MNIKALVVILGLGLLAFGAVVGMYSMSGSVGDEPGKEGKLSVKGIELEKAYSDLQAEWKKHEKEFTDKKNVEALNQINVGFTALLAAVKEHINKSKADEKVTATEREALPRLEASVEASSQIPNVFLMWQINSVLVTDAHWQKAKEWGNTANKEWESWRSMTRTLSR
ncbi:MAG: hypothetical protein AAB074_22090 [Planctomycetota bacterium]